MRTSVKLTEAQFLRQVIDLAHLFGWRCAHFRPGLNRRGKWQTATQADAVGWPDLFLVRKNRALALELKVGKNRPTPEQYDWINALWSVNIPAHVIRPEDWAAIEKLLRG